MTYHIPFNKSNYANTTLAEIQNALDSGKTAGDNSYTRKCHHYLEQQTGVAKALLTHSCTAALEMSALLLNAPEGSEVIMPSYTFVSTANAFVLQRIVPVFVDIDPSTKNIDPSAIEAAVTSKTVAIVPVHYAGVACDMDAIKAIADKYSLLIIEDAAQAFDSQYKGKPLGAIGHIGTYSFHETKNIVSGEGGAILLNDSSLVDRAEIIREKGTNRTQFFKGQVNKYNWVDIGSSYLPSDVVAAYLYSNLQQSDLILQRRMMLWERYNSELSSVIAHDVELPFIPSYATHNAHMFYLVMPSASQRDKFIAWMKDASILTPFHYVPLHSSPAGEKYARFVGDMRYTEEVSSRLVRLPLHFHLTDEEQDCVIDRTIEFFSKV
jgi:dTDP-4-amino-4,6-dideoxygalactose transaminase